MKKSEKLGLIEDYQSALDFIDRKTPLLENSDTELEKQTKALHKVEHKFKGVNFFLAWIVFTAVCCVPMSLLNSTIQTDLNFLYITPIVSIIVLYLYKMKYTKGTQKAQIKAMQGNIKKLSEDNKSLIGEINYSKSVADEALTQLLISQDDKQGRDILTCDPIYTNLNAVAFAYGCINEPLKENEKISPTFQTAIEQFVAIIEELKKGEDNKDLLKEFHEAELRTTYRKGVLKRCAKLELDQKES